jgi:hypothetical protein
MRMQDGKIECNYCGEEHFICDCPHAETNIKYGKCRRNQDRRVVLSTGTFILWDITKKCLHDHINKWHKQHPNQLAAATLIHTINKHLVEAPQHTLTTQANYQLTTNNCIVVLKAELFNLRTRRPVHPQFNRTTCAQKARNTNVDIDGEEAVTAARAQQSRIKEIPDQDTTPSHKNPQKKNPLTSTYTQLQPTDGPEHPYQLAKDAAYSLPVTKSVGAQEKLVVSSIKKPEPEYKTLPQLHDPLITELVYKHSLDAPITITQRKLLSLSPNFDRNLGTALSQGELQPKILQQLKHYSRKSLTVLKKQKSPSLFSQPFPFPKFIMPLMALWPSPIQLKHIINYFHQALIQLKKPSPSPWNLVWSN